MLHPRAAGCHPGFLGFLSANRTEGTGSGVRVADVITGSAIDVTGPGMTNGRMSGNDTTNLRNETEGLQGTFWPFSGGLHDIVVDGTGTEYMTPFPNLTLNLRDDHPVGIEVPAENFTLSAVRDPQFVPIGANSPPPAKDGSTIKFITRSAGILPNDIRDRLRAYPIPDQPGGYYIECASCHNPHTPRVNFLRLPSYVPRLVEMPLDPSTPISGGIYDGKKWAQYPNNGSAICLSCHAK